MKRRTILAALAAFPLATLTSTAHALGFRGRRRCAESTRGTGTPYLTLTYEGNSSGMELYTVYIYVDVSVTSPESIAGVKATLVDANDHAVGGVQDEPMAAASGLRYEVTLRNKELMPNFVYYPKVTAIFQRESSGTGSGVPAPTS